MNSAISRSVMFCRRRVAVALPFPFARRASRFSSGVLQNDGDGDNSGPRRPLPIAAFIDLDNVTPETFRRETIKSFLGPLRELGRKINHSAHSDNMSTKAKEAHHVKIAAFGNLNTRRWKSAEEKEHDVSDQEYISWDGEGVAQTGVDANGVLRCGVCGAKIKLSKKDKHKKLDLQAKLRQHMELHTREQKKRLAKMQHRKRGKKAAHNRKLLSEKEMVRYKKYQAAMVGLGGVSKVVGVDRKTSKPKFGRQNDLFQILKEHGVTVKAEDQDVDGALARAARKWMREIVKNENTLNGDDHEAPDIEDKGESEKYKGVLVVYSKDADFCPLLQSAKERGFLTVTATNESTQTRRLLADSDIAVGPFGKWWEEVSSFDQEDENASNISLSDESDLGGTTDEDYEDGFVLKRVPSASPLLASAAGSPSLNDGAVRAFANTDDGRKFMNGCGVGDETHWHLGDGPTNIAKPSKDDPENVKEAKQVLASIKELRRQHLTRQYRTEGKRRTKGQRG